MGHFLINTMKKKRNNFIKNFYIANKRCFILNKLLLGLFSNRFPAFILFVIQVEQINVAKRLENRNF